MDKNTIIRNFSRYAYLYDRYAGVQGLCAKELLGQIRENNFKRILEIGCGTGNYTLLLREKFSRAELQAIDISKEMIGVALGKLKDKRIKFITADAEERDSGADFDLVTSNACFQWFADLEAAFIKYHKCLSAGGMLSFSIFGPYTFEELNICLGYLLRKSVSAESFIAKEKIEKMLKKNFSRVKIRELRYRESFSSLTGLLRKIKYTGVRGDNGAGIFLNRQVLEDLEKIYLKRFGQVRASYQVFFCSGLK